jgi:hypothetical protein
LNFFAENKLVKINFLRIVTLTKRVFTAELLDAAFACGRSLQKALALEATINSYYGIMGHAESCKLRKALYHKHFGPLRAFFVPADAGYSAVHAKKLFLRR